MSFISIALTLFKFVNLLMKQIDEEKFREDGRRQAFVKERKIFDERTGIGRDIEDNVWASNPEDIRRELME